MKRKTIIFIFLLAFPFSLFADGVLTSDITLQLQSMQKQIQDKENWLIERTGLNGMLQSQNKAAEAQVDAVNNATANMIVRRNLHETKLAEHAEMLASAPVQNACDIVTYFQNIGDTMCSATEKSIKDIGENTDRVSGFDKKGEPIKDDPVVVDAKNNQEMYQSIKTLNSNLKNGQAAVDPGLVMGNAGGTLDDDQAKSMEVYNQLIVGTKTVVPPTPDTTLNKEKYVNAQRRRAMLNLVATTLESIKSEYTSINGQPSQMQTYQDFVDKYTSKDMLMSITATTGNNPLSNFDQKTGEKINDKNSDMSIAQVERNTLLVNVMQTKLLLAMYKAQLTNNMLNANEMALKINPLPSNREISK
ncbi:MULTISPECIES: hypothetical protein [Cysteiniphilum]|uniref:Uncharacterized protein n=1 Tax=Cysteiniphilum litorale TaxID=2056700 RepID=A0A8J2Z351_9GAMM|nr:MULTISPECIES: hypothetical protein [Cysteiniphilum]GGF92040.1 hypothetical protein GCM10010995_06520 [Cysteiniphilum litorale]